MATATAKPRTTETEAPVEAKLCSKCGKNPRADQNGTNPWCQPCKTEAQANYQRDRLEMIKSRGYAAGCAETRAAIVAYFTQWPNVMFSGTEIGHMLGKLKTPDQAV